MDGIGRDGSAGRLAARLAVPAIDQAPYQAALTLGEP